MITTLNLHSLNNVLISLIFSNSKIIFRTSSKCLSFSIFNFQPIQFVMQNLYPFVSNKLIYTSESNNLSVWLMHSSMIMVDKVPFKKNSVMCKQLLIHVLDFCKIFWFLYQNILQWNTRKWKVHEEEKARLSIHRFC